MVFRRIMSFNEKEEITAVFGSVCHVGNTFEGAMLGIIGKKIVSF